MKLCDFIFFFNPIWFCALFEFRNHSFPAVRRHLRYIIAALFFKKVPATVLHLGSILTVTLKLTLVIRFSVCFSPRHILIRLGGGISEENRRRVLWEILER